MKNNTSTNPLKILMLTFIILLFTALQINGQNLRITDEIGGGGTSTDPQSNSDNTFIYVAAGVVIGGILAYALLRDKGKEETDTTTTSTNMIEILQVSSLEDFNTEILKAKENIPFDIFFGIRNEDAIIPEKTYMMGLYLKF